MLIAEIRRKLRDLEDIDADTKEDVLTADVFGVLKYLPRVPYLRFVMEEIAQQNPTAEEFLEHVDTLIDSLLDVKFHFWPTYPTPARLVRAEPSQTWNYQTHQLSSLSKPSFIVDLVS